MNWGDGKETDHELFNIVTSTALCKKIMPKCHLGHGTELFSQHVWVWCCWSKGQNISVMVIKHWWAFQWSHIQVSKEIQAAYGGVFRARFYTLSFSSRTSCLPAAAFFPRKLSIRKLVLFSLVFGVLSGLKTLTHLLPGLKFIHFSFLSSTGIGHFQLLLQSVEGSAFSGCLTYFRHQIENIKFKI